MTKSSRLPGFNGLPWQERVEQLRQYADLSDAEIALLGTGDALPFEQAAKVSENVVGRYALPFSVATNFKVNGRDYLVPMVVEESSVVAAASYGARLVRECGGFQSSSSDPLMIAQVQLHGVQDFPAAWKAIETNREALIEEANKHVGSLVGRGGGVREVLPRVLEGADGPFLVVHWIVDVRDAMGANLVNTVAEKTAPRLEELTGGEARLRILSNLSDRRMARAECTVQHEALGSGELPGRVVAERIVSAWRFADADPYRACTHNKGIMNGVDPVLVATGNDWRAVEAGAHAWAARGGRYRPMTTWALDDEGNLKGVLEIPLAVGTVGGITRAHMLAQLALKILRVSSAQELAEVAAAVGLASNLAALKALATEGIQRGHMALHARNIAYAVGTPPIDVDRVVREMIARGTVSHSAAQDIATELRSRAGLAVQDPNPINQYATGKVILFGEHSVDQGEAALAVPVRDAVVTLLVVGNDHHELLLRSSTVEFDVRASTQIVTTVAEQLGVPPGTGLTVTGHTSIPIHAHLGSSAAFGVAVARALGQKFGIPHGPARVAEVVLAAERAIHGAPAGVDAAVIAWERPIWFRRGEVEFLTPGKPFDLIVAYSGVAVPSKTVNAEWDEAMQRDPVRFAGVVRALAECATQGRAAFEAGDLPRLGALLTESHRVLAEVGFSTPELDRLLAVAREAGALGGKLTGEGRGGCVIVLPPPGAKDVVMAALRAAGSATVFSTEIR